LELTIRHRIPHAPPYTTLFRSEATIRSCQPFPFVCSVSSSLQKWQPSDMRMFQAHLQETNYCRFSLRRYSERKSFTAFSIQNIRSEEHTSELQSRENLVCRLLL